MQQFLMETSQTAFTWSNSWMGTPEKCIRPCSKNIGQIVIIHIWCYFFVRIFASFYISWWTVILLFCNQMISCNYGGWVSKFSIELKILSSKINQVKDKKVTNQNLSEKTKVIIILKLWMFSSKTFTVSQINM